MAHRFTETLPGWWNVEMFSYAPMRIDVPLLSLRFLNPCWSVRRAVVDWDGVMPLIDAGEPMGDFARS